MNKNNDWNEQIRQIRDNRQFQMFDYFIISKMLKDCDGDITDSVRKQAYRKFKEQTKGYALAAEATMHRWFGIWGYRKPQRVHIFRMAVCMELSYAELEEYLTKGICECSVIVSDYHELLYLYAMENGYGLDVYDEMVGKFEMQLNLRTTFEGTINTKKLWSVYQTQKHLDIEEFLLWMLDNAAYFKGYSNTALQYLQEYRDAVLQCIRKDAFSRLEELLQETDYKAWKKKIWIVGKQDDKTLIKRYIKNKKNAKNTIVSDSMLSNLEELARLCFSSTYNNSLVYSELFVSLLRSDSQQVTLSVMTQKRMSDLFRVADQKKRYIKAQALLRQITVLPVQQLCSIEEIQVAQELGYEGASDIESLKGWLIQFGKEQRRRQLNIQKSDLLPFVLYVSQQKYLESIDYDMNNYKKNVASAMFRDAADNVLAACNMEIINENRELDQMLMMCYRDDEMLSFVDLLELASGYFEDNE